MAAKVLRQPADIGAVVRYHRERAGLSRVELADLAGVGKTVIYDVENGKETVRMRTLFDILEALNISLRLDSPLMEQYDAPREA